jgi:uncharacterized protein involved in response to NO
MSEQSSKSYFQVFCAEPFRVFFPLGWLCSLVGVSHWLWYYLGWIENYSGFYHGLFQIQGFELAFAAGFLMTALPRFLENPAARPWELALGVLLLLSGAVGLYLGDRAWSLGGLLGTLLFLAVFAGRRFARRGDNPPPAFVLVAIGLGCGLAGTLLLLRPAAEYPQLGQRLLEQGLLLGLVMAVGSYLGPRLLYGRREEPVTQGPGAARRLGAFGLTGMALVAGFLIEAGGQVEAGRHLRAAVVTGHLLAAVGIWRLPAQRRWHLYLLWLSFWCVPAGLWLAGIFPERELQALHLTFVGGLWLHDPSHRHPGDRRPLRLRAVLGAEHLAPGPSDPLLRAGPAHPRDRRVLPRLLFWHAAHGRRVLADGGGGLGDRLFAQDAALARGRRRLKRGGPAAGTTPCSPLAIPPQDVQLFMS